MWNFDEYTPCSGASRENFELVKTSERKFKFHNGCPKGIISLPYFILKDEEHVVFRNKSDQIVHDEYTFPEASENALQNSLQANHYNVRTYDPSKTCNHFCEFSGGGDIYITKDISSFLVFVVPIDEDSPATKSAPEGLLQVSPLAAGVSKMVSLTVEGKKESCSIEKLKFQLWANMIVLAVGRFSESLELMTKLQLLDLAQLSGYGIACSGDGISGVFKLEIDMDKGQTRFVTKFPLGCRERLKSAGLIDFTFHYYKRIVSDPMTEQD